MLFRIYGQAILTLHERHSRLLIAARPPGKAAAPIAHALLAPLPPPGAKRSLSITGRSLRGMTPSMLSASRPSSVRPTRPGKKAASRTPSAACAGPCRARPTWRPSRMSTLRAWSRYTIIPRGNVSAIRPQPRFLGTICCTSNVNPPSCFRRNDSSGCVGYFHTNDGRGKTGMTSPPHPCPLPHRGEGVDFRSFSRPLPQLNPCKIFG